MSVSNGGGRNNHAAAIAGRNLLDAACHADPPLRAAELKVVMAAAKHTALFDKLKDSVSVKKQIATSANLCERTVGRVLKALSKREDIPLDYTPGRWPSVLSVIDITSSGLYVVHLENGPKCTEKASEAPAKWTGDDPQVDRATGETAATEKPSEKDINQSVEPTDVELVESQTRASREGHEPTPFDALLEKFVAAIPAPAEPQRRAELRGIFDYFWPLLDQRIFEELLGRTLEAERAKYPSYVADALTEQAKKASIAAAYRVKPEAETKPPPAPKPVSPATTLPPPVSDEEGLRRIREMKRQYFPPPTQPETERELEHASG